MGIFQSKSPDDETTKTTTDKKDLVTVDDHKPLKKKRIKTYNLKTKELEPRNSDYLTPLLEAVQQGDFMKAIEELLNGANPTAVDENGYGLLRYALDAEADTSDVLKVLSITNYINHIDLTDQCDGYAPVGYLIKKGNYRLIRALLELGIEYGPYTPPASNPEYPQTEPSEIGYSLWDLTLEQKCPILRKELFELFVEFGFDINQLDFEEVPIIIRAARTGDIELVQFLLDIGCDKLAQSSNGDNILHAAATSGSIELVDYIMTQLNEIDPADGREVFRVMAQTAHGRCAFSLAIERGHIELIHHLVERYEASWRFCSNFQHTLLHFTTFATHPRVYETIDLVWNKTKEFWDIDARDHGGDTPLACAVEKGSVIAFDYLLAHKANPLTLRNNAGNLLHVAAEYAVYNQEGVDLALGIKELDINLGDMNTFRPMHLAIAVGNVRAVRSFLKCKDIDLKCKLEIALQFNVSGVTRVVNAGANYLHVAAIRGNIEIVDALLDAGVDHLALSGRRYTILAEAISGDTINLVKHLVNHPQRKFRAALTLEPILGLTPLHIAIFHESMKSIDFMLGEKLVSPEILSRNEITPFHYAAINNRVTVADKLLEYGADPRAKTSRGCNVLHLIAGSANVLPTTFDYIVQKFPDLMEVRCASKYTPILYAAEEGYFENLKALHRLGGSLTQKGLNDVTILHTAALAKNDGPLIADYVLEHAPTVSVNDLAGIGFTPLLMASRFGNISMMNYFWYERGSSPLHSTNDGWTLLNWTAYSDSYDAVKWLLEQIDPQTKKPMFDPNFIVLQTGQNALHLAALHGKKHAIDAMMDHGNGNPLLLNTAGKKIYEVATLSDVKSYCLELYNRAKAKEDALSTIPMEENKPNKPNKDDDEWKPSAHPDIVHYP